MPLLGHNYPKIYLKDVQKSLKGLNLEVVGGLKNRGWTSNDIDVIGEKKDILILAERLKKNKIHNPVHDCGSKDNHSHIRCVYYGIKLALTKKGY